MKVIINADDFGMSEKVNLAILNAAKNDHITSSTILAVGNNIDEAISMTKNMPEISFGIHLALTGDFISLSKNKPLNRINWKYNRLNLFQLKYIINEFSLQIERLKKSGIEITHIDTHHHIHRYPIVLIAVMYIGKKYKINKIRTQILCHNHKYLNMIYRKMHNGILRLFNFKTTDCYTDFVHFFNLYDSNPHHIIEIMTHPGSNYNDEYYFQYITKLKNINLINYRNMDNDKGAEK